ncbi:MAG: hypothetical protein ACT4OY_02005 [Alphaproteobacteria bacterium]
MLGFGWLQAKFRDREIKKREEERDELINSLAAIPSSNTLIKLVRNHKTDALIFEPVKSALSTVAASNIEEFQEMIAAVITNATRPKAELDMVGAPATDYNIAYLTFIAKDVFAEQDALKENPEAQALAQLAAETCWNAVSEILHEKGQISDTQKEMTCLIDDVKPLLKGLVLVRKHHEDELTRAQAR